VQAAYENGVIKISWDASSDESKSYFDGYNIYFSKKSLILRSTKDLPSPIPVDKNQHELVLQNLEGPAKYFIHVRSRNKSGDFSFPSLPEVVVQPTYSAY
jgi:hypothetical protein